MTIMRPIAELDAGPICPPARRADPARRRLRQPRAAAGGARRRAAGRGARQPAGLPRAARRRASPTPTKIEPRGPPARPRRAGRRARAPRAGAHSAHRRVRRARRRRAARRAPGRRSRPAWTTSRPGELAVRDSALLYGAAAGRARAARGAAAGQAADGRGRLAARPRRLSRHRRPTGYGMRLAGRGGEDQPRARVPVMRGAVAARHQPRRAATAASTACAASSCAPSAPTAAPTRRSPACRTPRT